ncbi:MAG: copper transporter [Acidimicrobiia bacterium]
MINFRFHLVSLVAVFLALAVGVVMGYGVLGQPTVETLEDRINTVEAKAEATRLENGALKAGVEQLEETLDALEPFTVTDRLADASVLVVAVRGVDPETMQGITELARRAGASAPGILWIEAPWTLAEAEDRGALAAAIEVDSARRSAIRERGWQALIERLNQGPGLASDLLSTLTDAGFVSFEGVDGNVALGDVGGLGTQVLLVVGTDGVVQGRHVLVPAAQAAVEAGLPITAAEVYGAIEGGPERGSLVGLVRKDEALAADVPTVDDVDLPSGSAVALLALADLARGTVGHYGVGQGSTAAVPEWWQP